MVSILHGFEHDPQDKRNRPQIAGFSRVGVPVEQATESSQLLVCGSSER